jgi:ABC-type spermidine/putrescine transport system permease subunit I
MSSASMSHARLRAWYSNAFSARGIVWAFALAWSAIVFVPLGLMFVYSFLETRYFEVIWDPGLQTWQSVLDGRWTTVTRTLRIALTVTLIELLVAFPFALWLAKGCRSPGVKAIVLSLITIPFFLDLSSRTIVLRPLLAENGLINTALVESGLRAEPISWLLYSEFAVHLGMIAPYFPVMVLPIFLVMTMIDDDYIAASNDLGASPWQTLVHVIIPLSMPGVAAGTIFTLGPAMAAWVEPAMLGGGFVNMLSQSVESAYTAMNYPVVAALSTLVILLLGLVLMVLILLMQRVASFRDMFGVLHR